MIKEAWDSFKDNIRERISNPFLGTFVLVWVVHNWKVVYAFFYFDKDWKLQQKIDYFNEYWAKNNFFWNLVCVALITIGILIITYLFLALSRYLGEIFENIIVPFINRVSRGKIVTEETYNKALDKIVSLEEKIEKERKAKNDAITEREEMEKKFYSSDKVILDNTNSETLKLSEELTVSKDYSDLIQTIKIDPRYSNLAQLMLQITKKYGFSSEDDKRGIDLLLMHEFIYFDNKDTSGRHYNFTDDGLEFKRQFFAAN